SRSPRRPPVDPTQEPDPTTRRYERRMKKETASAPAVVAQPERADGLFTTRRVQRGRGFGRERLVEQGIDRGVLDPRNAVEQSERSERVAHGVVVVRRLCASGTRDRAVVAEEPLEPGRVAIVVDGGRQLFEP